MPQLRNTFDAESLGALESVLDEIHRELADGAAARPVVSREQLAKLVLHYAQDGESDPEKLRTLVLKGIARE